MSTDIKIQSQMSRRNRRNRQIRHRQLGEQELDREPERQKNRYYPLNHLIRQNHLKEEELALGLVPEHQKNRCYQLSRCYHLNRMCD
jgi:hypothetical protein